MGAFWTSWQLWEKLCFCLAVAIFLTLCAGSVKLLQQRWQLRKYTSIAAKRMEQRQEQQEMQRAMSTRRERKNDVPFGVRAIESGIEVDGVWISRGNTPVSGSPVSLATRPSPGKPQHSALGSTSSIPDLSMPQPAHPVANLTSGRNTSASSRSQSPDSRFGRSRGSSVERYSPMRGVSPQPEFASHARQNYRPRQASHLRYSSADVWSSSEDVVTDPNRPPQLHNLQTVRSGSDTSLSQETPVSHYMPTKPSPTKAAARRSLVVPQTLSPRSVSPTHGHDGQFSFERIPLNSMGTPASAPSDPFITPRESPTEESKDYFGSLPSFQSFVETDTRNAQHEHFMGESLNRDYENPYPDHHAEARTQQHGRDADVMRKVNSGFEILRPGTLGTKPVDPPRTYQPTTGDDRQKRQSRKLQKRVRSSTSASRRSMFSEDVV